MMMIMRMKMMRINRFPQQWILVVQNLFYVAMETTDVSKVISARRCGMGGQVGGLQIW